MSSNSLPEAYNSLLDQNIRSGSLVAYWCLKARLIRLCAIAFHKWVRYSDEMKRVLTNSPSDNVNRNSIGYISTVSSIDRNDPTSTTIPNNTKQFQNSGDDEDDVMSEEMENLRMASRGNRSRRGGVAVPLSIPSPKSLGNTQNDIDSAPEVLKVGTDTIEGSDAVQAATNTGSLLNSTIYKTASMKRMEEEKKVDEFASAMHDAIIDGKRNLLLSLARDIISGAGLTTSSLALLDNSMTLNGGGNGLTPSHKSTPNRRSSTTRYFLGDTAAQKASPNTNRGELENERGRSHMNVMLNDVPRRARSVSPLSLSARSSGREEGLRPGQRRYSHSVSPTSRRARAQDEQKRIKNELLNKTRPHSEQYQRVKMMREVKSSMLNNRDTKAPAAVYAFGSSTTSARNIANRPSTETRDEIIYNPDHYLPHQHSMFQSVPSYGYGQHKPSGPSRNRIPAVAKTSSNRQAGYLNPTHSSYARQSSAASQPNLKRSPTISRSNSGNTLGDRDRNSQNYRKKENYPGNSGLPSKSSFSDSKSSFDENSYNASDIYLETAAPHHVPRTMEFPSSVGSKTRQPKPPPRTISKAGSSSYNGTVNGTYEVGKPPKGMDKAQWLLINGIDPHQAKNQSFKLRGRTGFK